MAGPRSRPAGFNPVNGAPSASRCTRTSVSKKYRSASSFSFAPLPRTADVRSKASRISPSFSLATQGRTRVTSPFSRAFFARMTTGPSIVSQWARALPAEIHVKRMIAAERLPNLAILLMFPSFPARFHGGLPVDPDDAIFFRRHPLGIDPCQLDPLARQQLERRLGDPLPPGLPTTKVAVKPPGTFPSAPLTPAVRNPPGRSSPPCLRGRPPWEAGRPRGGRPGRSSPPRPPPPCAGRRPGPLPGHGGASPPPRPPPPPTGCRGPRGHRACGRG